MIPILYADGLAAVPTASTPVAGRLTDCVSCVVDREINGIYELIMQYPRSGQFYDQIALRSLIYIQPDRTSQKQLFRIYRISKPLLGVVTIYARHIAYDLAGYVRPPFTAAGIATALSGITTNTKPTPCPFTFTTTRSTASTFTVTVPCDIWALMAGQEGSLLDVYGGEYDFDNFSVTLENRIGTNTSVTIEYAKNLTQLLQDENAGDLYTGIYPYYYTPDNGLVTLPEGVVAGGGAWTFTRYKTVDLTDKFQTAPTEAQLRTAAQSYVTDNGVGELNPSLDVDFVPLEQTVEYGSSVRETVALGDTVTVKYTALGVNATARIVATKYNCLRERFDKLTVGSIRADLGTVIKETAQNSVQSVQPGTPVASKGAVVNHAVDVTPSVTNVTGFINGGTKTGTPVTVTAAELVSGTKSISQNGQGIDVGNYKYVDVAVPGGDSTFVVTLSYNSTSQQWEPNKTYAEISAAYSGGKTIVVNTTEASNNVTADGEMTSNVFYYVVRRYLYGEYRGQNRNQIIEQYYELRSDDLALAEENTYPLPSGSLTITANTPSTNVEAYAAVAVNVPGVTNMITGTFTTPSSSGVQSLTLPYTGNGYPIALMVFVAGGEYASGTTWYTTVKRYAVGQFTIAKSNTQIAPSYGTSGAANQGVTSWVYKNSTSSSTSYSRSSAMTTNSFSSSNATTTAAQTCRFKSATELSYNVIGSSGYGLLPDTEYRYIVFYSS